MPVAVLVAVELPVPVAVELPVPVAVLVAVELLVPVAVVVEVTLRLAVGWADVDDDGEALVGVGPRLAPGSAGPIALPGCVPLAEVLTRCVADEAGGKIVVLVPVIDDVGPLLEDSSTATMAMTPTAATPIPP